MVEHGAWAQQTFQTLHCALHPEGALVRELLEGGVGWSQITALYPFELATYIPALEVVLSDSTRAKAFIARFSERVNLSASTIQTTGADFSDAELDEVEEFWEQEIYLSLFAATMAAYTDNLTTFPEPKYNRSPSDHANVQVDQALRQLIWAAWLVTRWGQLLTPEGVAPGVDPRTQWARTEMAQKYLSEVVEDAQAVVECNWAPLLKAYASLRASISA